MAFTKSPDFFEISSTREIDNRNRLAKLKALIEAEEVTLVEHQAESESLVRSRVKADMERVDELSTLMNRSRSKLNGFWNEVALIRSRTMDLSLPQ